MATKVLIAWDVDTHELCAVRIRIAQDVTATQPISEADKAAMRAVLGSNGMTSVQNPDTGKWHTLEVIGAEGEEQIGLSEGTDEPI